MNLFLDLHDISFAYDKKKPALTSISLRVPARLPRDENSDENTNETIDENSGTNNDEGSGIFVSIIGPNGSGKTTLLKILAGILPPATGTALLLETPVTRIPDPSKILAYVPQTLSLGFSLSVLDFILLGIPTEKSLTGKVTGQTARKAQEALKLLHIEDYARRDILKLSGGEKQKIILTKALAQETPALLLDEPITHLDLAGQIEILDLLKKLTKKNKKIIAIMHDINLAARYSDYTIMLKNGTLFAAGKTQHIITEQSIQQCFSVPVKRAGDFFIPIKTQ
ncbi:MAG: ABC transporter ATP-binding protein [Spirochaetales bacterium]|jgi:iron complex transport system ATP-binding protein|nr:ABC transporter ATP-binding protein [Spirochaetales bacterium]